MGYEVPSTSESEAGGRSRHGSGASFQSDRKRSLTPERTLEATSAFSRTASGGVGPRRFQLGPYSPKMARAEPEQEDAIRDVDQPDPPASTWEFASDPHGQEADREDEPRAAPRRIPKYSDMLISYSTIPGSRSVKHVPVIPLSFGLVRLRVIAACKHELRFPSFSRKSCLAFCYHHHHQ